MESNEKSLESQSGFDCHSLREKKKQRKNRNQKSKIGTERIEEKKTEINKNSSYS